MQRSSAMREWHLDKLARTLLLAEIRCLPWSAICARLLTVWSDDEAEGLIYRVREMTLSNREAEDLANAIKQISEAAESLRGGDQTRADRRLVRLALALPTDRLYEYALADLAHSRKLRRAGAYMALKKLGVSAELASKLILRFRETGDQDLLTLIARSPEAVHAVDVEFLLSHLGESYWRMRVIEALMRADDDRANNMSAGYPREFAHAAGRCRDARWISAIRRLISPGDLEMLQTVAWALGVLGDSEGLAAVREIWERESAA
jgi:hypothetical protein